MTVKNASGSQVQYAFREFLRAGLLVIGIGAAVLLLSAAALYHHVYLVDFYPESLSQAFAFAAVAIALMVCGAWLLSRRIGLDSDRVIRTSWGSRVELRSEDIVSMRIVEGLEQLHSSVYGAADVTLVGRDGTTFRFKAYGGNLPALDAFVTDVAVRIADSLRCDLPAGIPWGKRARLVTGGLEVNIRGERTVLAPRHVARTMKIPAGLLVFRTGEVDSCVTLPLDDDNAVALRVLWESMKSEAEGHAN